MNEPCPGNVECTIEVVEPCPCCKAFAPTILEVRIDDVLIGTCEGVDEGWRLIGFVPVASPAGPLLFTR